MPPEIDYFYKDNKSVEQGPPITLKEDYTIMDSMFEWNLTPEEWSNKHVKDQANMMAYVSVKRTIEGYISDWYRKKQEVNS